MDDPAVLGRRRVLGGRRKARRDTAVACSGCAVLLLVETGIKVGRSQLYGGVASLLGSDSEDTRGDPRADRNSDSWEDNKIKRFV